MAKYFGTNGIRGRMNELTPELALSVSAAFGKWRRGGKIVVGRDMRKTGELLRDAVLAGLLSAGCDVIDIGIASSPTVEYMNKKLGANGAVIISASHNPPEWNGLKFIDGKGVSVSKERGEEIERIMGRGVREEKFGKVRTYEGANEEHIEAILKFVDAEKIRKRKLHVVLDCGNGTACPIAPSLFRRLGCKIFTLNSHMDGNFPGRGSEPTRENLRDCSEAVKENGADLGIAWDGDCDRVIFIDERGNWIVGDKGFAINAKLALRAAEGKAKVATTVATSNVVRDVCKEFGAKIVYTKVGAPYLSEAVARDRNIISAGEEVGGIIWPEFSLAKDGFLGAVKICEAVCEKPLSEWVRELPLYYNAKTKIPCASEKKQKVIDALRKRARREGRKTLEIDGVRIDFKDSWVIVRASGTEEYLRVFAEAKSEGKANALMRKYEKIARGLIE